MARLSQQRLLRALVVAALAVGVLVATFGAGYRSSEAVLGGASAFLQRDHGVVRVNAESGDVDAETARELATGEQRLDVVQVRPGVVYVVNTESGRIWRMPTDTMEPLQVEQHPDAGDELELAAGGDRAYLVNGEDGTVAMLEDRHGTSRHEVALPDQAPVSELVVDSSGVAWALSVERGELYAVDGGTVLARHPVADPGEPARLTLAGDRPVVYLPGRGVAASYGRQGRLDDVSLLRVRRVEVAAPGTAEPVLVTVVPRTAELVTAYLRTGETNRTGLVGRKGHRFGPPVVANGRAYVPDYTYRQVVVVRLRPLHEQSFEPVGGQGEFEVFGRDGRVWVTNPYHPELLVFGPDGRPSRLDKRTGEAEGEDQPEPTTSSPPPDEPEPRPSPPEEVAVPDVVGLDRIEACSEIRRSGLDCDFRAEEAAEGTSGAVLSTQPSAGQPVPAGSTVLIVFRAPPKTAVPPAGQTLEETCAAIQAAALTCKPEVAGEAKNMLELHRVVSVEPSPGTEVEVGSEVRVGYLVRAATYPVPDVLGKEPFDACVILKLGFLECVPNASEVHWERNRVHVQGIPAGTQVAPGTRVEIVYSGHGLHLLTRYRYVGPNSLQPAWRLTTDGDPGGNWEHPHQFGGVYGPHENAVPGLVPVYQATCPTGCGVPTMYFYSRQQQAPKRPPMVGATQIWSMPATPAFRCFEIGRPGTAPLMKLYSEQRRAWTFAIRGSAEYDHRRSPAGGGFQVQGNAICHVWYGVPSFPGS